MNIIRVTLWFQTNLLFLFINLIHEEVQLSMRSQIYIKNEFSVLYLASFCCPIPTQISNKTQHKIMIIN